MRFTNEHYALCEMINIVNESNTFLNENKEFNFEEFRQHSLPEEIREKIRLGWFINPLLDADYFNEYRNDRIHILVKDIRDGKVHPLIAKILIADIKKIHDSKTCEKCNGDGFGDGRLAIPSLENIALAYKKNTGLQVSVDIKEVVTN